MPNCYSYYIHVSVEVPIKIKLLINSIDQSITKFLEWPKWQSHCKDN